MFRKLLLGLVALAGLTFVSMPTTADAGWRRAYRHGYYAPYPYYGGYYYRGYRSPRYYSYGYYPRAYYYSYPGYYYPPTYYYGPGYYGPGVGITTRNWGFYIR